LTTEILIIFLLLVANGIFAMSEIAVVAARKILLQQRAEAGDKRAKAALRLAQQPTQFLSTVQVGITLVGIFAGAYGGATVAETLAARLREYPALAPYSEAVALGLVVTALTYFSLIIGELVPKAIALSNPEGIAGAVAAPVAVVARAATPLVRLLSASTHVVLALFRVKPVTEHTVTEEEIRGMVKQATLSGEVAVVEQRIVERVFQLGDRRVQAILTPRHEIEWVDINESAEGLRRHLLETEHPRLLVCDGSLDRVLGVVHVEQLLARILAGGPARVELRPLLKPPLFVPSTLSVFQLLEAFRTAPVHVALALDEFGATEGIVTPIDILEALVGDLPGEPTDDPGPIYKRDERSWLVDGTIPIEDLMRDAQLPPIPDQDEGTYHTLAGFVMTRLGRVPHTGDRFTWNGYHFEVVDMDGRRVDKVLIERVPPAAVADDTPP
jgi:putative hemolysin